MEMEIKCERMPKRFKLTYEQYEEPSEKKDEEQKDQDLELPLAGVKVQVKITEIDEDRVAVEFNKLKGDFFLFRKSFDSMRDKLSHFNNAVIDESLLTEQMQE